jgi:hypothetical protein
MKMWFRAASRDGSVYGTSIVGSGIERVIFRAGRSQEKTHLLRLEFFLLLSPLDRARSVLIYRAMCSVAGQCDPLVWVFSTSGFHRFFATKPVSSETSKAERWSNFGDHSSIWDSWPIAFSGCPRGPRVGCETRCPRHTAPNYSAETRSRTRVSREPDGHRQRKSPEMKRTRSETLKLFVVLDVGRRSTLLSSTRSTRWWQSSWPKLDAPSPA